MVKLKLQYFGHLMWRGNSLEKTLMLGKTEGRRRRERQRMRWLDGTIVSMDMSLSNSSIMKDSETWHAAVHGVTKSLTQLGDFHFPSIRVFSSELALCIRWPNYWSFSFTISPSSEYSGLISFRMVWSPCSPRDSQESSPSPQFFKNINSSSLSLLYGPTLTSMNDYWKNHSSD